MNEITGFYITGSPASVDKWDLVFRDSAGQPVERIEFDRFEEAVTLGCALFPEVADEQGASL
jgi:hypothetical protein